MIDEEDRGDINDGGCVEPVPTEANISPVWDGGGI